MDSDTKKLIRAVVRRVHPDLFTAHPFERQRNSDSLKALNSYVEQVGKQLHRARSNAHARLCMLLASFKGPCNSQVYSADLHPC